MLFQMAIETQRPSVSQWMGFVGFLLVLIGLYGVLRIIHVSVRGVPYPIRGVFPSTIIFPGIPSYGIRESECESYPQVYYDYGTDGKQTPRLPAQQELDVQQQQAKRCTAGFNEDRSKQKQYDKNQAAFLIFVGAGLLFARRFLD